MPIYVHVTGLKQTFLWFKKHRMRTGRLLRRTKLLIAKQIATKAKQLIHERAKYAPPSTQPPGPHPGRLAESFHIVSEGQTTSFGRATLYVMAPYAAYVEEGTRPHFIPFGLGRIQGVEHPGAKPMYFMRDAVSATIPVIRKVVVNEARALQWLK